MWLGEFHLAINKSVNVKIKIESMIRNKTGLQPVSKLVEQKVGFFRVSFIIRPSYTKIRTPR